MTTQLNTEMSQLFEHVFQSVISEVNQFASASLEKNLKDKLLEIQNGLSAAATSAGSPISMVSNIIQEIVKLVMQYKTEIMAALTNFNFAGFFNNNLLTGPTGSTGSDSRTDPVAAAEVSASPTGSTIPTSPTFLDKVITKENTFNSKLEKVLHASVFNVPGVKQIHQGRSIKLQVASDPKFHQLLQSQISSTVQESLKTQLAIASSPASCPAVAPPA